MHRFFVQSACSIGDEALLLPDEARHAAQVLRLRPGDAAELLDGQGLFAATLSQVDKQQVRATVLEKLPDREPKTRVTLFQGLAKGDKMETIVQKCTELGVHAVQPVDMARCVQRMDRNRAHAQCERLQRIAREATKQCGRAWVPSVHEPLSLDDPALKSLWSEQGLVLVPWEDAASGSLRSVLDHGNVSIPPRRVGLVIGPEGGMTEDEIAQMHSLGATIVTLGPRILRTETAGIAALSAIMTLCGEME